MPKIAKTKNGIGKSAGEYVQHGWKKVRSSSTGAFYTSRMPIQVKNSMIEASKEQRVLSTGTVVINIFAKNKNNNVTKK